MQATDTPEKFPIPFAASAGGAYKRPIPVNSQIGIVAGAASLTDGFPPLTFTPVSAGGTPPFGQDFNGLLYQLTAQARWSQAGGAEYFDAAFVSGNGGYPKGASLQSTIVVGTVWISTADNNTTDPDSDARANWIQDPSQVPIGTPVPSFSATVPAGYVPANGRSIGNAASNATNRANADTWYLFWHTWLNSSPSICPIYTSAGVLTTRGANAAADFAANKAIAVRNMQGAGLIGVDTMGGDPSTFLNNVPIVAGSTTTPGSTLGVNTGTINGNQLPVITLGFFGTPATISVSSTRSDIGVLPAGWTTLATGGGDFQYFGAPNGNGFTTAINSTGGYTPAGTVQTFGAGAVVNFVERSLTCFWNLKL